MLYVNGDESAKERLLAFADEAGRGLSVRAVADTDAARVMLQRDPPDCLITEYGVAETDGLGFCEDVRALGYDGPMVLYTERGPRVVARRAFGIGVDDFAGTLLTEIHTAGFIEQFGPQYEAVFDGERATFGFDHGSRCYRADLVQIYYSEGDVDAGLTLTVDITERREYERELKTERAAERHRQHRRSRPSQSPARYRRAAGALRAEQGDETMKTLIDDLLELARSGQTPGGTKLVAIKRAATTCWDAVKADDATLITDSGPTGVADASRLDQVFDNRFYSAIEDDGPGIGLAIVSEVANAHG